jgi:hypothetical protein
LTVENKEILIEQLVEEHNFRISTRVYDAARKAIFALK